MSLADEVECRTEISYLRATGRLPKPPENVGTRIETIMRSVKSNVLVSTEEKQA